MNSRDDMLSALEAYDTVLERVPHARFSDLYFRGERTTAKGETVDEALDREARGLTGGDLPGLLRILARMVEIIEDPSASRTDKDFALQGIEDVATEINELIRGKVR